MTISTSTKMFKQTINSVSISVSAFNKSQKLADLVINAKDEMTSAVQWDLFFCTMNYCYSTVKKISSQTSGSCGILTFIAT